MLAYAKANGLKRLKVGSLEVEISDYELALLYTEKLQAAQNLTNANTATQTPSPSIDANIGPNLLADDDEDESLLFHSTTI